jgi:hypothetical protein
MKIAFLFMIYDIIEKEEIWLNFFEKVNPDLYTIYIHGKNNKKNKLSPFFSKFVIEENYNTGWGEYSIVNLQNRLFELALKDNLNYKFILMSGTHIPLHNFNFIYEFLIKDNNSYFSYFNPHKMVDIPERKQFLTKNGAIHIRTINNFKKYNLNNWVFGSQWSIMTRDKIDYIIKNEEEFANTFSKSKFPDEFAYINFLLSNNVSSDIVNLPTSYVTFRLPSLNPKYRKYPCTFDFNDISDKNLMAVKSGYLFMRKIANTCKINKKIIFDIILNLNTFKLSPKKLIFNNHKLYNISISNRIFINKNPSFKSRTVVNINKFNEKKKIKKNISTKIINGQIII